MEAFVRKLIEDICHAIENPLPIRHGLARFFEEELVASVRGTDQTQNSPKLQRTKRELIPLAIKQNQTYHDTCFQLKDPHSKSCISVAQIRVLQQRFNGSCGYYALYNVLTAVEAVMSTEEELAAQHLSYLEHNPRFWHMYSVLEKSLLEKVRQEGNRCYPWNTASVSTGILERNYLYYFLHSAKAQRFTKEGSLSSPSLMMLQGKLVEDDHHFCPQMNHLTVLSDFGVQSLKYNCVQLFNGEQLQKVIRTIRESVHRQHAFLLGVMNHWVGFLVNKISENNYELLFLDSRNKPLLGRTKDDLWKVVDELLAESAARRKYHSSNNSAYAHYLSLEERRKLIHESLKSCQLFMRLLIDAFSGKRDIMGSLLDLNLEGFLEIYGREVGSFDQLELLDDDSFFSKFIQWMENYMPPPVFEQNFVRIIKTLSEWDLSVDKLCYDLIINEESKMKLRRWVSQITKRKIVMESTVPFVARLVKSIRWIELYLQSDSERSPTSTEDEPPTIEYDS